MVEKTLAELEAYRNRLQTDVRRSQALDTNGLTRDTPLMRNLKMVEQQIRQKKSGQ